MIDPSNKGLCFEKGFDSSFMSSRLQSVSSMSPRIKFSRPININFSLFSSENNRIIMLLTSILASLIAASSVAGALSPEDAQHPDTNRRWKLFGNKGKNATSSGNSTSEEAIKAEAAQKEYLASLIQNHGPNAKCPGTVNLIDWNVPLLGYSKFNNGDKITHVVHKSDTSHFFEDVEASLNKIVRHSAGLEIYNNPKSKNDRIFKLGKEFTIKLRISNAEIVVPSAFNYTPIMATDTNTLHFEGNAIGEIKMALTLNIEAKQRPFSEKGFIKCRSWNKLDKPTKECVVSINVFFLILC
jgi:hypothetical protein